MTAGGVHSAEVTDEGAIERIKGGSWSLCSHADFQESEVGQ